MTLNYFSVVYGIEAVLPGMLARGKRTHRGRRKPRRLPAVDGRRAVQRVEGGGRFISMEGLRLEVASRGIAVTVMNPGFVRTPLTARNTFKMPFLVEADDAAERIVRGLERGKHEIHFPGAAVVDDEGCCGCCRTGSTRESSSGRRRVVGHGRMSTTTRR